MPKPAKLHIVRKAAQDYAPEIPLLDQKQIVESMDSSTLCMLAQGIIEQPTDEKKLTRAKVFIDTAARQVPIDPSAYYLRGQTKQAAEAGYIPAMYMSSLQEIEQARSQLLPEQQHIIDTMLTTLKKHKLPDETTLPLIQSKINKIKPDVQVQDKTIEESFATLHRIVTCYMQNPEDAMKPWVVRACYALGILQAAGTGEFCILDADKDAIQPISIAACEGFEPALSEFVRLRMLTNKKTCDTFPNQFEIFKRAAQRLQAPAYMGIIQTVSIESLIEDAITCIQFYEDFFEYIHDIPFFNDTLRSVVQTLIVIDDFTHNYKARCLRAIIILNRRTQESLAHAFDLLEPLFNKSDIQYFIAKNTNQATKKFLRVSAENDPQASFLIGLMLCATKSTQQKAYDYFMQGAAKNHVYSLLSAANMILKGFDPEKNQYDAAFYYMQALDYAVSQDSKKNVLAILKNAASSNYIPVHCLYLTALLEDPKEQKVCADIVAKIESSDQIIFNQYIDCFRTHQLHTLFYLAEQGNDLASRLLGYIFFARVQESKGFNLYELHISLGKLRNHSTTPYSRTLTSSIAFSLAQYYQSTGNVSNALRLYTIATEYGHKESLHMAALLRLKQLTSISFKQDDIQLIEELAEQGNIEAQEVLAKLYSGLFASIQKIRINKHLKFRYLTNIQAHGKADQTCIIQLAKMLCSQGEDPYIEHNEQRAFELFKQACQQGYQLQEDEYRIFGILAFNLKQDEQAIELLEHSKPDKTVLWLRSILYLKHPDEENLRFQKALYALDEVLRIEHDDIELPDDGLEEYVTVLKTLRPHVGLDIHVTEIFLRLCYTQALDDIIIAPSECLHLLSLLEKSPTLSSWNFMVFLQRHAIKIHDSIEQLWYILEAFITDKTLFKTPCCYKECTEQLLLLAEPLLHKNEQKPALSILVTAIKAAQVLSIIYSDTNLINSCYYCALAEDAITSFFRPTDDIYDYARTIGSLTRVTTKAKAQQQIAAITTMIYAGYRLLKGPQNLERINSWLKSSTYILQELEIYTKGKNTKRDHLVAIFYVLVGKLTLISQQDAKVLKDCRVYFEKAFELDPQLPMALAHLSFIQLYDSTIYDEQRSTALKTLKKLAKQNCPEACLILGNLYQPGAPALPHSFQITQSEKTAQTYFSQIGVTYSHIPEPQSSWFSSCLLL